MAGLWFAACPGARRTAPTPTLALTLTRCGTDCPNPTIGVPDTSEAWSAPHFVPAVRTPVPVDISNIEPQPSPDPDPDPGASPSPDPHSNQVDMSNI